MSVRFVYKPIETIKCDAIVNSLGVNLKYPGRICESLYYACDSKFEDEIRSLKQVEIGDIFVTDSYGLPCKKIINVVMPFFEYDNNYVAYEDAIRNILLTCVKDKHIKSIAIPFIGNGANGYPVSVTNDIITSMLSSFNEYYKKFKLIICMYYINDRYALSSSVQREINLNNYLYSGNIRINMYEYLESIRAIKNKKIFYYNENFFDKNIKEDLSFDEENRECIFVDKHKVKCFNNFVEEYILSKYNISNNDKDNPYFVTSYQRFKFYLSSSSTKRSSESLASSYKIGENGYDLSVIPEISNLRKTAFALKMKHKEYIYMIEFYGYDYKARSKEEKVIKYLLDNEIYSIAGINETYIGYGIKKPLFK